MFTSLLVLACLTLGQGAWAANTVSVNDGTSTKEFETLVAAFQDGIITGATSNVTVTVSADQTIGSQLKWAKGYTLTITPTKALTFTISKTNGDLFRVDDNGSDKGVFIIGSTDYAITIVASNSSDKRSGPVAMRTNDGGHIKFINTTFKDFDMNNATDLIISENGGDAPCITLQNVTLSNCTNPKNALINNLRPKNAGLTITGTFTVGLDCTGTTISQTADNNGGRMDVNGATITNPITINWNYGSSTNMTVAVNGSAELANKMSLTNTGYKIEHQSNNDLKAVEASTYSLTIGDAKAATLVLPFAATIPTGVSCYALSYTSGDDITATEVITTLPAHTPVLVTTSTANTYSFAPASFADPVQDNILVGVYSDGTNIAQTTGDNTNYILQNQTSKGVGFYKIGTSGHTVNANRAYMSVTHADASTAPAREFFAIDFDGNGEVTGIKAVETAAGDVPSVNGYYDLQGRRVAQPTKGLYIVNGKKVVVK